MGVLESLVMGIAGFVSGAKALGDLSEELHKSEIRKKQRIMQVRQQQIAIRELERKRLGLPQARVGLDGVVVDEGLVLDVQSIGPAGKGKIYRIKNLDDRIKYIRQMVAYGVCQQFGMLREIASISLTKQCGDKFCTTERDWPQYIKAVRAQLDSMDPTAVRRIIEDLYKMSRSNILYTPDVKGIDTYQSPMRTIQLKIADCDDYAIALSALLASIGFDSDARVIKTKKNRKDGKPVPLSQLDWSHIYLVAYYPPSAPKKKIVLDASVPKYAGWEAPADMIVETKDYPLWRAEFAMDQCSRFAEKG